MPFHEERILSSRCGRTARCRTSLVGGVEQRAFVIGQLRRDDAEDILVFKRFGIAVILKIAMLGQAVVALGQQELRLGEAFSSASVQQ